MIVLLHKKIKKILKCENCGKKSIFYTDLFDIVDNKGENTKDKDKADSDFEYWWRGYYKK